MKLYHWIGLGVLVLCLGCNGGDAGKEAEEQGTVAARQDLPVPQTQQPPQAQQPLKTREGQPVEPAREPTPSVSPYATEVPSKDLVPFTHSSDPSSTLPATPPADPTANLTAEQILTKMVSAYKNATSYTDQGQLIHTFDVRQGNQPATKPRIVSPYSMSMEKPNKVALRANLGMVISDGRKLYGYIDIEVLRHQFIERPAPANLTIGNLYPEPLLTDAMAQGLSQYYTWLPIQEILLFADKPLNTLLFDVNDKDGIRLLEPGTIENQTYYRVSIRRSDGEGVFWIDPKTFVLRRFEFPMEGIKRDLVSGSVMNHKVVADFQNAQLNAKLDPATFEFSLPLDKVHKVQNLVPIPILMTGKPAPDFYFDTVDGKPVTLKSLAGKTVVIDFWANWSTRSRLALGSFNQVAQLFRGDDRVVFLTCNTDQKLVKHGELKNLFNTMKISLPICVDPQHFAEKGFHIPGVPTVVIIGPKGRIQSYQYDLDIHRGFAMQEAIQMVADGKDLSGDMLGAFNETRKNCDVINRQMIHEDLFISPAAFIPRIELASAAEASEPAHLKRISLWKNKNVGVAGNILVVHDSPVPRILVCHDSRAVAELDTKGNIVKNYQFMIPADAAITNLRTGMTAGGERFYVGFAPSIPQCFLLDKTFQVKWAFPASAEQSPPGGIADVRIVDLNGDRTPEILIGYRGKGGVRAVSLAGEELWTNREVTGITKMAVAPGSQGRPAQLLCTSDKCLLFYLDGQGRIVKRLNNAGRRLYWIDAAQLAQGDTGLCGLFAPKLGKNEAMGLNLKGDLIWACSLPDGASGAVINRVTTGRFFPLPTAQWVLLAPDSSIYILSDRGKPLDRFNYGAFAAGMATARIGNQEVLLISSLRGVEAIALEVKR